ncbi:MAG: hypothetical protein WBA10_01800 [Elainellaceae cyanobacterium]
MTLKLFLSLAILLSLPLPAAAQTIQNIDDAPNGQFSDRVSVAPGTTRIFGQLEPPDVSETDYTTSATMNRGDVNAFTVTDLPANESFFVWVQTDEPMDAIMGQFDSAGNLLTLDDDSSPFGNLAPAIRGVVPSDGTLHLKVSGLGDNDFDGFSDYYEVEVGNGAREPHYQVGDYTLSVMTDDSAITGDLDFFTLTGLTPGNIFSVVVNLTESGASVGWLADDGSLISRSTYAEAGNHEQVSGIVPASGEVHFVVSGFDDFSFDGSHGTSGDYLLTVESRIVEVP